MRVSVKVLAVILPVIFAAGIGGTIAFNLWKTESSKEPAVYSEGDFAGKSNPADIRGSYSLADVEKAFGIPAEVLASAFGLENEENYQEIQCKVLEERYGGLEKGEVGTDSVRYFVALYMGMPYEPEEDTFLLSPAVSLLKDRLSPEALETAREKTVLFRDALSDSASEIIEHGDTEERAVKGYTTFKDLYDWGISKEEITEIIGLSPGPSGSTIRDYCTENGIEFSSVKSILQQFVDSKN